MGILEMIGETARVALSKPQQNTYVVVDQWDQRHTVKAEDEETALRNVCRENKINGNRCRGVVKVG